jgi:hypothetical protein
VSIAVGWNELLAASTAAAVVSATGAYAAWEGGRIYTYTHLAVVRAAAGELADGNAVWVRTRGGVVGHIGQQVEGEANFAGGRSLVFMRPAGPGFYEVTARAQGQFPVEGGGDGAQPEHVVPSHAPGLLVPRLLPSPALPPALAADVLANRTLDDAVHAVAYAWSAAHAR